MVGDAGVGCRRRGLVAVAAGAELFGGEVVGGAEGATEGTGVDESGLPGDLADGRRGFEERFGGMAKAEDLSAEAGKVDSFAEGRMQDVFGDT